MSYGTELKKQHGAACSEAVVMKGRSEPGSNARCIATKVVRWCPHYAFLPPANVKYTLGCRVNAPNALNV